MSTKKKIILHGHLAELYPHPIEVEGETVAECIRVLEQIPELKPPPGQPHPVTIRDVNSEIALFAPTEMEEIHVYPRMGGAGGKNGLAQILIGVALIAVGIVAPGISMLGGLVTSSSLILAGGTMLLGGIVQMLTPMPEATDLGEQKGSNYLGATGNTVRIGTHIPLAYGNVKMGGHYLSFDVDAKNQAGVSNIPGIPKGDTVVIDKSVYTVHDKAPISPVPVLPVYPQRVASANNTPTASWS